MGETVVIPGRFNGPQDSGNGGYGGGLLAEALGGRVEASLRKPLPLDKPLELVAGPSDEAASVRLLDGGALIAEAQETGALDLEVPAAVDREEARRAAAGYRGPEDGLFSHCFVCGRGRPDSMGVFAGAVEGRELVASPWTPPSWSEGEDGTVRPAFVWAALDCPTYFACYLGEDRAVSFLVRQSVEIKAPVEVGEEHVVIAWPLAVERNKRSAGAALLDASGTVLATARALLVEPRQTG